MRVVAPALALEIALRVAIATAQRLLLFVSWPEALVRGPGLDQGAIDYEVRRAAQPPPFGQLPDPLEKHPR